VPARWNTVEPIRKRFSEDSEAEIIEQWIQDQPPGSTNAWNDLMFTKRKPRALIIVEARRWGAPQLNSIAMELESAPFLTLDGPERLRTILKEHVTWTDAVYANVYYSGQAHRRVTQMTPLQRLEQAYWLNFFGQPYIDMFGRERLLSAPCYGVEEFEGRGVLLQAAARFDSADMINSDRTLIDLEEYLEPNAFAGRGYPQIPCLVPNFDLSETTPVRIQYSH
jgi:hypothetical protein